MCCLHQDYDRKFCSMCAGCNKAIVPRKGETRVQKLRALGKDFHLACFKCEVSNTVVHLLCVITSLL